MGIGLLKKLLNEAKSTTGIITIEATVITGFEPQAVDECREVCKPVNVARSKGRIFFNIKKESYPNVLKMRSIDNVFLVSEAFEELNLKKVKEEDLVTVKNLADQVNWAKSVPEWAEIVEFKGVQFPKCANSARDDPLGENDPVCLVCKTAKAGGGDDVSPNNPLNTDSPKISVISEEEIFQTPCNDCPQPDRASADCCSTDGCNKVKNDLEKYDSALESSPDLKLLSVKPAEDMDDDAFHSAEEDFQSEGPGNPSGEEMERPNGVGSAADNMTSEIAYAPNDSIGDAANKLACDAKGAAARKQARHEKEKAKWLRRKEKRREGKRYVQQQAAGEGKPGVDEDPEISSGNEPHEKNEQDVATTHEALEPAEGQTIQSRDKKKNYWQRRKEAKEKKAAEAKAKKPPRKPYIDDGIMKFRVTCYRNGPKHSFESNDAAGHFGGQLNDKFHWTVDLTRHDINVVLVIEGDSAYVSLALTQSSLHRRNIKSFGPTTLRATLCYSLVRFAEPLPGDIIMDPMCGGGSISIEGALGFPGTYHICGDVNEKCVERVRDNIAFNSTQKPLMVDGLHWSVRRLPLRDQCVDILVTDLPFGLRVGKQKDNSALYIAALSEIARVVRPCGKASLLTYDKTAMIRAMQRTSHLWRQIYCNMVNQGGLRCFAYLLLRRAPIESVPGQPEEVPAVPETNTGNSCVPQECATVSQLIDNLDLKEVSAAGSPDVLHDAGDAEST